MTEESDITVYDQLRRDLICGRYAAGEKLMIGALQRHYAVGLSPLREALNRLAAVGLLEQSHRNRPNEGVVSV